tara:strand:- start:4058 stop:5308 length:1251 start_codon:yes stop_codon:yes gene_type:complete
MEKHELIIPEQLSSVVSLHDINDLSKAQQLAANYAPLMNAITEKIEELKTLDKNKPGDDKKAKRIRIDVGHICSKAGKEKDKDKEYIKIEGKLIDGLYSAVNGMGRLTQKDAEVIEKHAENVEKERLADLQMDRELDLSSYSDETHTYDLSGMKPDAWEAFLEKKKSDFEAIQAAEKKSEEERLAKEKAEKEEKSKLRKENEALQARQVEIEEARKVRSKILLPLADFIKDFESVMSMAQEDFDTAVLDAEKESEAKAKADRIAANKKALDERKKLDTRRFRATELGPYIGLIDDYEGLLSCESKVYDTEFELLKSKAIAKEESVSFTKGLDELDDFSDEEPVNEVRGSGRTTRIIDECIQELFNTGEVTVKDHEDKPAYHIRVVKAVAGRLAMEHGFKPDNLKVNYITYHISLVK